MFVSKKMLQLIQVSTAVSIILISLSARPVATQDVEQIEQYKPPASYAEPLEEIVVAALVLSFAKGAIDKLKS